MVHSRSGYNFKQNFFGQTYDAHTGIYHGPQNETGTVDNIAFQYAFSFGALSRYPEDWWGDGPDVVVTAFGLLSIVDSKAPPIAVAAGPEPRADLGHEHQEAQVRPRRRLHAAVLARRQRSLRLGAARPGRRLLRASATASRAAAICSFAVLTGRLLFKTQFVTHEMIQLQYSHYSSGTLPTRLSLQWVARADSHLVGLFASMWW